jgi:hypothetical protein
MDVVNFFFFGEKMVDDNAVHNHIKKCCIPGQADYKVLIESNN